METHKLSKTHLRKFTAYQEPNFKIRKATFSFLPRPYIVSDILALYGMKGSMIALDIWDYSCASWNLKYGCTIMEIYMNIFPHISTPSQFSERDPQRLMDALEIKYKFELKGTGPISFNIECDIFRDSNGVL